MSGPAAGVASGVAAGAWAAPPPAKRAPSAAAAIHGRELPNNLRRLRS